MYYTHCFDNDKLAIALHGEIDHHAMRLIRSEIDGLIEKLVPRLLVFDLSDIVFCDSSGLGFLMGRYKKISALGGMMYIYAPSEAVRKILSLSGMDRLIKIKEADRKDTVKGFYGGEL